MLGSSITFPPDPPCILCPRKAHESSLAPFLTFPLIVLLPSFRKPSPASVLPQAPATGLEVFSTSGHSDIFWPFTTPLFLDESATFLRLYVSPDRVPCSCEGATFKALFSLKRAPRFPRGWTFPTDFVSFPSLLCCTPLQPFFRNNEGDCSLPLVRYDTTFRGGKKRTIIYSGSLALDKSTATSSPFLSFPNGRISPGRISPLPVATLLMFPFLTTSTSS